MFFLFLLLNLFFVSGLSAGPVWDSIPDRYPRPGRVSPAVLKDDIMRLLHDGDDDDKQRAYRLLASVEVDRLQSGIASRAVAEGRVPTVYEFAAEGVRLARSDQVLLLHAHDVDDSDESPISFARSLERLKKFGGASRLPSLDELVLIDPGLASVRGEINEIKDEALRLYDELVVNDSDESLRAFSSRLGGFLKEHRIVSVTIPKNMQDRLRGGSLRPGPRVGGSLGQVFVQRKMVPSEVLAEEARRRGPVPLPLIPAEEIAASRLQAALRRRVAQPVSAADYKRLLKYADRIRTPEKFDAYLKERPSKPSRDPGKYESREDYRKSRLAKARTSLPGFHQLDSDHIAAVSSSGLSGADQQSLLDLNRRYVTYPNLVDTMLALKTEVRPASSSVSAGGGAGGGGSSRPGSPRSPRGSRP